MTLHNPFLPTRFEYESCPLIWKSPNSVELEKQQSYFLKGTRGSGKTSILKSISWKERLSNITLRDQINQSEWDCIAVYFRLPDHMSQSLSNIDWEKITPEAPSIDTVAYNYFSLFIEAIALESLLEASINLRSKQIFNYDLKIEESLRLEIIEKYPELSNFDKNTKASGFIRLKSIFDRLHHEMNAAATRGTIASLFGNLPIAEACEMLNYVSEKLYTLLSNHTYNKHFHFKICVDDCETLKDSQQIYLNSMVRKSKAPICWVVSFVTSDYESASTLIHNQKLSDSDRKVIDLDDTSPSDFRLLCAAVTSLRIYYSLTEEQRVEYQTDDPAKFVNLNKILGGFSVNQLFSYSTKNSLGKELPTFRKRVEFFQDTAYLENNDDLVSILDLSNKNDLPYYQTYLLDRLYSGKSATDLTQNDAKKMSAFSAMLRRKQVGAYLCMSSEYGVRKPAYAGCSTILSMSDKCIRDFLEIMGSVFESFNDIHENKLIRFALRRANSPISIAVQSKGTLNSSEQKFLAIKQGKQSEEALTSEVAKLIEGLGVLTSKLQSSHLDIQCLKTTERGVFIFDFEKTPPINGKDSVEMSVYIKRVVKRAMLDGLLRPSKIKPSSNEVIKNKNLTGYRLHKRYAAHYGFSYRGAYEPVVLNMLDVARLLINSDSIDGTDWANTVYESISSYSFEQSELAFDND